MGDDHMQEKRRGEEKVGKGRKEREGRKGQTFDNTEHN